MATSIMSWASTNLKSVQEKLARRTLNGKLQFSLDAARSHEANGLPAGHPAYKLLYNQAFELCEQFVDRFQMDPTTEAILTSAMMEQHSAAMKVLFAETPALFVLRDFAEPGHAATSSVRGFNLKATLVMAALASPVLAGVIVGVYHHVVKFIG